MIRDITIGQYYPTDSVLHRLDPRTKIILTFVFISALFIPESLFGYGIIFLLLAVVIKLSKVPLKFMLKGLKAIVFIIIFTIFLNLLFTPGDTVLVEFWVIKITLEGVLMSIMLAIRLMLLIVVSSLLTLTTSPISLTDGIEALLKPLTKIKVPAHEIAMMMTIALRFIPILLEETDKIMKAQTARGADFESGSLLKRAKNMLPLLVPLFISSFRRADDLALAMEARCYRGGEGRTRMKQLKYQKSDYISYLTMISFVIVLIVLRQVFGL